MDTLGVLHIHPGHVYRRGASRNLGNRTHIPGRSARIYPCTIIISTTGGYMSDNITGKKKVPAFLFILPAAIATIGTLASDPVPAQPKTEGYKGWATVGDGTTGGKETDPVNVKTPDEFSSAITGNNPRLILVSGVINLTPGRFYEVGSNKTIRGLGTTARLSNGTIRIQGQTNVILQNLAIRDAYDPSPSWDAGDGWNCDNDCVAISGSNHVWVDHCEIFNTPV
ncbi:MAG: hypothetical protein EHM28_13285, partial [Spirochaetaceae bacterium]